MALRDYNAAVDFVDRNVAEGRSAPMWCAAAFLKFCVIWRRAC